MKVSLVSRFPLGRQSDGVAAEFVLNPGETTTFILRQVEENGRDSVHDGVLLEARLVGTEALTQALAFWRQWLRKCNYSGRWREMAPLGAGAEAADVRTDRRDRGGADLRAAGRDRRDAQLGLSLYLGARRRPLSPITLSCAWG
jgi:hypothetical protein